MRPSMRSSRVLILRQMAIPVPITATMVGELGEEGVHRVRVARER